MKISLSSSSILYLCIVYVKIHRFMPKNRVSIQLLQLLLNFITLDWQFSKIWIHFTECNWQLQWKHDEAYLCISACRFHWAELSMEKHQWIATLQLRSYTQINRNWPSINFHIFRVKHRWTIQLCWMRFFFLILGNFSATCIHLQTNTTINISL